jgi:hypothetical protein
VARLGLEAMAVSCDASASDYPLRNTSGPPPEKPPVSTPESQSATPDAQSGTPEIRPSGHVTHYRRSQETPVRTLPQPQPRPIESRASPDEPHRSKSTDVAIRDLRSLEPARYVTQLTVVRDGTNLSACRHCPEQDFGDPLEVTSEAPTAEARPAANSDAADKGSASSGLSQLLSKILEQLNISSWLPAAMLVGNAAVLLQLHSNGNFNITGAVKDLSGKPLGTLIVLAFALLLAAIITQAFEFEIIRLLEGYLNSTHGLIQAGVGSRIRRHETKRSKLEAMQEEAEQVAFMQARKELLADPEPPERAMLDLVEDKIFKRHQEVQLAPDVASLRDELDWQARLSGDTAYRLDCIEARLESYPESNRVMPTRLGNVLRAAEDRLPLGEGEDIEGFVIRHYDELSPSVKDEHKDYRTRLDMYCCLVLVFTALAPLALALLIGTTPTWGVWVFVAAYGIMAYVCYEAAIASARGYGEALDEMGRQMTKLSESA